MFVAKDKGKDEAIGIDMEPARITVWQCPNCGEVYWNEVDAKRCACMEREGWKWVCKTCGCDVSRFLHECNDCRYKRLHSDAETHVDAAAYDGMVYYALDDSFHDDYETLLDDLAVDDADLKEYALFGTYEGEVRLQAATIVDGFEEQADFDGYAGMSAGAVREIEAFCDEWNKNHAETRYCVDWNIALDVEKKEKG